MYPTSPDQRLSGGALQTISATTTPHFLHPEPQPPTHVEKTSADLGLTIYQISPMKRKKNMTKQADYQAFCKP